jgi:hypothetical protein
MPIASAAASVPSGPVFEAERALGQQDLKPVQRSRTTSTSHPKQGGLDAAVVYEVDDMRVLTDRIERQSELVEHLAVSGRPF